MPTNLQAWLTLGAAIVGELLGTAFLKLASSSSQPWPWLGVIGGYGAALWLLEKVIQRLDVGVVYALWSGVGIALASALGVIVFGESMSWRKALGLLAIAVGVILLQLQTPE